MCKPWTDDEDAVLRELYPAHGRMWDGWAEALPGRTPNSIRDRARRLGLVVTGSAWSAHDVAALRELYPLHGAAWDGWAEVLDVPRSPGAIRTHANNHGIFYAPRKDLAGPHDSGSHWATCDHDAVVMDDAARGRLRRAYMAGVPFELLSERFGRTPDALRAILRREGVRCR